MKGVHCQISIKFTVTIINLDELSQFKSKKVLITPYFGESIYLHTTPEITGGTNNDININALNVLKNLFSFKRKKKIAKIVPKTNWITIAIRYIPVRLTDAQKLPEVIALVKLSIPTKLITFDGIDKFTFVTLK